MFSSKLLIVGLVIGMGLVANEAEARLGYTVHRTGNGPAFVIVSGAFEYSDDLLAFRDVVAQDRPLVVSFDSPGGNVAKAMEFGRLVRSFGLSTLQVRAAECASACSLAFLGGIHRFAQPGSIGVHKSSFSDTEGMPVNDAVSAVQQVTAEVIGYMSEMGVDPGMLQLSLSYDSDDIRYLSGSEMTKYKVTTPTLPPLLSTEVEPDASRDARTPDGVQAKAEPSLQVPLARSGSVRHPKGKAPIKASDNPDSKTIGEALNGSSVQILDIDGDWYRVAVSGSTGYMHYSWVHVTEFEEDAGDGRYVQVKSFGSLPEAEAFVKQSPVPLAAHLAANGWFAVTLRDVYAEQEAKDVSNALKAHGLIAKDSMITLGNTYVRKICCE
ncbi:SH3 domain-containing protein [Rhizobium leguminosarum]|uniref:SH3 domain-containing protein n=1 Tax=Rhizobium leguminosarum TaxID=384 RepID=UPI00144172F1|nr:SH3 domain-containing protein [Rhizobium leguminosarum]MBY5840487.1 SH3 domain-containing protein [Rhizobium leguminosarum]NKM76166.1 SH3 domain-containing protein [Rhizobium leguminosarum bv. viciae]QSZ10162.1 SH3 domain-containing protein [Rhizobium leguminosarum]